MEHQHQRGGLSDYREEAGGRSRCIDLWLVRGGSCSCCSCCSGVLLLFSSGFFPVSLALISFCILLFHFNYSSHVYIHTYVHICIRIVDIIWVI